MFNKLSFKAQIRWLSIGLILLTVIFLTVNYWYKTVTYAEAQIERQMHFAQNVLEQNLATQERILTTSASVLAADFGFKQAVATRDNKTIESVLDNHGNRIHADLMMLLDLKGQLITVNNVLRFSEVDIKSSIKDVMFKTVNAQILSIDGKVLQVITVPVNTPRTIAYALIGFEFNQNTLQQLKNLLSLEISLTQDGNIIESTLNEPEKRLKSVLTTKNKQEHLLFSGSSYYSEVLSLGSSTEISVILSASLVTIQEDFNELVSYILLIALIVMIIGIVFSTFLSKSVSTPLNLLMELTQKISKGHLKVPILQKSLPVEFTKLYQGFALMGGAIEQREQEIVYQAQHDILTGLYNRNMVLKQVTNYLADNTQLVLVAVSIKNLKGLNDTIGTINNDKILKEIALRITHFIHNQKLNSLPKALSARIDTDEFLLALPINHTDNIHNMVVELQKVIEQPYSLGELNISLSIYFGITNTIDHEANAERLIGRSTMTVASAIKENQSIRYYQEGEDEQYLYKLRLIDELKEALNQNDGPLFLNYQPKLNIATGKVDKLEALIRWINKEGNFVNPELFVGLAEKSGLIITLTRWVILSVVQQISTWNTLGYTFKVSINLSAQDIEDAGFVHYLVDTTNSFNVSPSQVTLELTERDLAENEALVCTRLSHLKSLGFEVSVDDYGIGQSSLAKLKNLPVDELKIDKCFILTLDECTKDQDIVASTISLGHKLGLRVVAEGVENKASLALLNQFKCDYAQGFYLSRPLTAVKFIEWYEQNEFTA